MLITLPILSISLLLVSLSMYLITPPDDTLSSSTDTPPSSTLNSFGYILFFMGVIIFLLFFSFGFGALPWAINSEIYPVHLTGTGVSLSTATNWTFNFIVSSVFLSAVESTRGGKIWAYAIFAGFAGLAMGFVWVFVPETAGRTIEENVQNII